MGKDAVFLVSSFFRMVTPFRLNPAAAFMVLGVLLVTGCGEKNVTRSYYPSGSVKTEAVTKDAVLNGRAVMLAEGGQKLSEAEYRGGVLNGKSSAYFPDGKVKATAEYQDGALHGLSTAFHANGQKASEAQFHAGVLLGKSKSWTDTGAAVLDKQ